MSAVLMPKILLFGQITKPLERLDPATILSLRPFLCHVVQV